MAKRRQITCKDCYFRQAALCALVREKYPDHDCVITVDDSYAPVAK